MTKSQGDKSHRILRTSIVIVMVVLLLGQSVFAAPSPWASRSIAQLQVLGILQGGLAADTLMQQPITREEFAELSVALYLYITGQAFDTLSKVHAFKDTSNPYVGAAFRLGIITGFNETTFSPKAPVTREQIASMLHREILLLKLATNYQAVTPFADAGKISPYAKKSVEFAQYHRLIQGVSNNRFDPQGKATREQVYKIIEGITTKFNRGITTYPVFTETLGLYKVPKSSATDLVLSAAEERGISLRIQSGPVLSGLGTSGTETTDRPTIDIERQWLEIYDILSPVLGHQAALKVILAAKDLWLDGEMRYLGPRVIYVTGKAEIVPERPPGSSVQLASNGSLTITVFK